MTATGGVAVCAVRGTDNPIFFRLDHCCVSWAGRGRLPFGDVPGEVFELLPLINTDRHYKRRGSGSGDAVCVGFDSLATGSGYAPPSIWLILRAQAVRFWRYLIWVSRRGFPRRYDDPRPNHSKNRVPMAPFSKYLAPRVFDVHRCSQRDHSQRPPKPL